MQKKNCVLCISIGIIVCILLSACSRQPDFDAKSYVQSSLDAHYHGEYKDYANLLEISEKDAKKEIEEDFNESIQQQFDDSDNITDKGIADYAEKLTEVKKLAKYKVQDVKEEDGVYTVSVQVEPSNVFQTLQQSSTEVSNEKIKQGLDGNDPGGLHEGEQHDQRPGNWRADKQGDGDIRRPVLPRAGHRGPHPACTRPTCPGQVRL